jgi:hypothetical protein
MVVEIGQRYLFMGQRYAWSGTVRSTLPTHATLGEDAMIHYEDIGPFEKWSSGEIAWHKRPGGKVPGQIVSLLGTDITPCGK